MFEISVLGWSKSFGKNEEKGFYTEGHRGTEVTEKRAKIGAKRVN